MDGAGIYCNCQERIFEIPHGHLTRSLCFASISLDGWACYVEEEEEISARGRSRRQTMRISVASAQENAHEEKGLIEN